MYHAIFPCSTRTNNNVAVSPATKVASCMIGFRCLIQNQSLMGTTYKLYLLQGKMNPWAHLSALWQKLFYINLTHSLYLVLVWPLIEHASVLWDLTSKSLCDSLESVQFFALRIIFKSWSQDYESLLDQFKLPTLTHRQKKSQTTCIRDI